MEKSTKINGFTITFMAYPSGCAEDDTNNCYIEKNDYSGSLALAENLGGIENIDGNFLPINEPTLNKIISWAQSVGY